MISGTQAGGLFALQIITVLISTGAIVVAVVAYNRSKDAKKLDLRLALGKELNNLRHSAGELAVFIDAAERMSRQSAQKDGGQGGSYSSSDAGWEADRLALGTMIAKLPARYQELLDLSESDLSAKTVELHQTSLAMSRLNDKYTSLRRARVPDVGMD